MDQPREFSRRWDISNITRIASWRYSIGWLKKEEEEDDDEHAILTFDCFRFATLKSYYTHCYYYCSLGQAL